MDRVWRFSFYTDTTTVTVHIRRLRAKIEPDPANARVDPDRVGRRVPLPAGAAMRRRSLIVVAAGALAAAIIGPVYGAEPGARDRRARGRGLGGRARGGPPAAGAGAAPARCAARFGFVVGTAVAVILATVLAAAELMFVSNHDALDGLRDRARGRAGRAARGAGRVGGRRREVESIRDALRAVGRRRARAARRARRPRRSWPSSPSAANAMIEQLARRGATARRGGLRAAQPRRGDLARPAHPDDGAAADGRRDRGRPGRRGHARALPRHDAHPRDARSAR